MADSRQLFLPDGPLARAHPGYETRPGQMEMADAVQQALTQEHILLCEAGTGTGKTIAYLLPALLSGKKIVVSTATRALQDQLVNHDVPLAEEVLGRRVRVVVMKGLSNYLCLRRYAEARASEQALTPSWRLKLGAIESWREESEAGDLSELAGIPEGDPVLAAVRSSSETRIGPKCPHHAECFVTRLKQAAESAELIITNHHLFFADLALRGPHPGRVLPHYDAAIFDEAHQLEDVATLFFGVRVTKRRIDTLVQDAARLHRTDDEEDSPEQRASDATARFFDELLTRTSREDPRRRLEPDDWAGEMQRRYLDLDTKLDAIEALAERRAMPSGGESEADDGDFRSWDAISRRARALRDALATIVEGAPGRVTWLENDSKAPVLSSSAVDVSEILRERLFNTVPSVVLTSATLTTSPARVGSSDELSPFAFTRGRLGAYECETEVRELVVDSPFDFAARALLYVPRGLPAPNDASFIERAQEEIRELVEASDGGAFVLTTSLRSMRALHDALSRTLGTRLLLVQGSAPKQALLSAFRRDGHAVLVATMSFWEGVDVPGEALRLVILEKIPFSVPSDPILQARAGALEADGQRPFNALFLPLAQMTLKQGFGRLIRTQRDRGVVALLDSRVHTKGYGQRLLSQLPPARRTTSRADAVAFLGQTAS
jgi:ATP-dependent DNA helicase DinG